MPDTKTRIKGEYENNIRRHCNPEKAFYTFATFKEDGNIFSKNSGSRSSTITNRKDFFHSLKIKT